MAFNLVFYLFFSHSHSSHFFSYLADFLHIDFLSPLFFFLGTLLSTFFCLFVSCCLLTWMVNMHGRLMCFCIGYLIFFLRLYLIHIEQGPAGGYRA